MLGDAELQALGGNLRAVSEENQKQQHDLQKLLDQFQSLLDSYSRLKSDYEEEKEGRERYKKLAKTQERNPFVLVLVDGDGYLFKDHLIKSGAQGGVKAAQLLSESITDLINERLGSQADQCRIMVRIYSNVLGLSKTLARVGLVGNEARSFSSFTSSFTRAQDLFDYVDAGDKKEGADYKIRGAIILEPEMFRLFADNQQCKHIFFAGCHDTGYLSLLTPYRGKTDRITLIKAASFHHEFDGLDFAVRELPGVFMSTQFGGSHIPAPIPPTAPANPPAPKVCAHYQKGICRYGNKCTKVHQDPNQKLSKTVEDNFVPSTPSHSKDSKAEIRGHKPNSASLPIIDSRSLEFIPMNKDGERIDPYVPPPSKDSWDKYKRRAALCKPCNNYYLAGCCNSENCELDHRPIEVDTLNVLNCKSFKTCKFGRHAHFLDYAVTRWEEPIERQTSDDSPASETSENTTSTDDMRYADESPVGVAVQSTA
ncbi:zinc finger CCCH domain-containing protein [Aspergillus mulundensis]|uniref:C3H1-type domain-containing protein n=1 Tax=Aspergillus mulundensis TaxID=1810919 RepID=A0A3D8RKF8_9EURO|nr:Uncharacterized protein DSM5745_07199 [Aspergillus mulundensis]RDW74537.1 Uncharacterized protein DSM5745_07199 [Aspergillus mulundensis]